MTTSIESTEQPLAIAEIEARRIVNGWSVAAAAVGWVPGSMLLLAAADVKLVNDVARAFNVKSYGLEEVASAMGASVTGKIIAGELLTFIPIVGWAIKSSVAASVTKAMGETLIKYFRTRSALV